MCMNFSPPSTCSLAFLFKHLKSTSSNYTWYSDLIFWFLMRWATSLLASCPFDRVFLTPSVILSCRLLLSSQPTNDIDLDTLRGEVMYNFLMLSISFSFEFCSANFSFLPQTALEGYLEEFQGVLVVVSHDRLFTDKVCVRNRNCFFHDTVPRKDFLKRCSFRLQIIYSSLKAMV